MGTFTSGFRQAAAAIYKGYFSLPHVRDAASVCRNYRSIADAPRKTLDLGCGRTPKNPFEAEQLFGIDVDYGVDEASCILPCDLGVERIPFDDNYFDYVTAFDLFEHIPRLAYIGTDRRYPFIFLMSECYRVLKPGGYLLSDTPCFPRAATYVDPTHVNTISIDTFPLYFARPNNWASRYGFEGEFHLSKQAWCNQNLITLLQKPFAKV
ncbi:MAG: class I SAM-dependent methyltransferase [Sphingomonas sp.]|nr:MAG: class I SAM-dependent methyltransferase [Sphingomonas sp.]